MFWLRIFLSIILSVCILWITAIFAGAPLIQYAAKKYFGSALRLNNIEISSRLALSIGNIEIEQMLLLDGYSVDGTMQAVSFEWSILGGGPEIKISSGPFNLDNGVEFQSASLSFGSSSFAEPLNGKFKVFAEKIVSQDYTSITSALLEGNFNYLESEFFDVTANLQGLSSKALNSEVVYLKLDRFLFDQAIEKQNNFLAIVSNETTVKPLDGHIARTNAEILNESGFVKFTVKTDNAILADLNLNAASSGISGSYSLQEGSLIFPLNLNANLMLLDDPQLSLILNKVVLNRQKNSYVVKAQIETGPFDVQNTSFYYGSIPPLIVWANFTGVLNDEVFDLNGGVLLNTASNSELNAEFNTNGYLELPITTDCMSLDCLRGQLNSIYKIKVDNASMTGRLMCLTLKCDFKQSGHKITTDNTVQLFNNLNNLKLFNPMVLATLYSNFLAGQKVKNGHEINFGNLEINY